MTIFISNFVIPAENDQKHIDVARWAISQMKYETAVTELTQYLELHPEDVKVMHLLAKTYSWDNHYEDSARIYEKLLKLDPEKTDYLIGRAKALIWLKKYDQAIPLLDKAWKQQPNNADTLQNLIMSLNLSNTPENTKRARELGITAREKFPNVYWDMIVE